MVKMQKWQENENFMLSYFSKYGTSFKIKIINKIQMYRCRKKATNSRIIVMII